MGMLRTLSPEDSISVTLKKKTAPRRQEGKSAYIQVCNKGSRQSELRRSGIKLRNLAFCVWEDASLWALNSLLSYTPQLRKQETNGVSLSTLRSGRWLLLVFPQLLSIHLWLGGSICWISVLGALGCPGGSAGKEPTCSVGDLSSILGLGRSPREENGYPLQYSGLENSMDRGGWESTTHGVAKSWTRTQLSDFRFYSYLEAGNC